jgi:hypothetical protein
MLTYKLIANLLLIFLAYNTYLQQPSNKAQSKQAKRNNFQAKLKVPYIQKWAENSATRSNMPRERRHGDY